MNDWIEIDGIFINPEKAEIMLISGSSAISKQIRSEKVAEFAIASLLMLRKVASRIFTIDPESEKKMKRDVIEKIDELIKLLDEARWVIK
jgi:hypothetical protein